MAHLPFSFLKIGQACCRISALCSAVSDLRRHLVFYTAVNRMVLEFYLGIFRCRPGRALCARLDTMAQRIWATPGKPDFGHILALGQSSMPKR